MSPFIERARETILAFPQDLSLKLLEKDRVTTQIRVRVIAFGESNLDPDPIKASSFFTLLPPEQTSEFSDSVRSLAVSGSGPSMGLEAFEIALRSGWTQDGNRQRHVIVVLTNSTPRPELLDSLQHMWETGTDTTIGETAKRLVLVAPDVHPWNQLGDGLSRTVFLPAASRGFAFDDEYEAVLELCCNAV